MIHLTQYCGLDAVKPATLRSLHLVLPGTHNHWSGISKSTSLFIPLSICLWTKSIINSALLHLTLPISWLHCPYFQFIFSIHRFLPLFAFCQSLTSFYFLTSNSLFILFLQTSFYSVLGSILHSFLLCFPSLSYPHSGSLHLIFYYGNFVLLTVGLIIAGKNLHFLLCWTACVQYQTYMLCITSWDFSKMCKLPKIGQLFKNTQVLHTRTNSG